MILRAFSSCPFLINHKGDSGRIMDIMRNDTEAEIHDIRITGNEHLNHLKPNETSKLINDDSKTEISVD